MTKNFYRRAAIAVTLVGFVALFRLLASPICDKYEGRWYRRISDTKFNGMHYAAICDAIGNPIYKESSSSNRFVSVFSPYSQLGLVGRYISRARRDPVVGIVFEDNKCLTHVVPQGGGNYKRIDPGGTPPPHSPSTQGAGGR